MNDLKMIPSGSFPVLTQGSPAVELVTVIKKLFHDEQTQVQGYLRVSENARSEKLEKMKEEDLFCERNDFIRDKKLQTWQVAARKVSSDESNDTICSEFEKEPDMSGDRETSFGEKTRGYSYLLVADVSELLSDCRHVAETYSAGVLMIFVECWENNPEIFQ